MSLKEKRKELREQFYKATGIEETQEIKIELSKICKEYGKEVNKAREEEISQLRSKIQSLEDKAKTGVKNKPATKKESPKKETVNKLKSGGLYYKGKTQAVHYF